LTYSLKTLFIKSKNIAMDFGGWRESWGRRRKGDTRDSANERLNAIAYRMNLKKIALGNKSTRMEPQVLRFNSTKSRSSRSFRNLVPIVRQPKKDFEEMFTRVKAKNPDWQLPKLSVGRFVCMRKPPKPAEEVERLRLLKRCAERREKRAD